MKKTLFVKFLFLLLCGSVLTTAGCKDYDDDIDALRNDVEDLKGAVVELNGFENRIAALERTQAAFEAIDFSGFAKKSDISSLQTQIEGCVKDSDLAAKIVAAIESSLADGALQENLNSLKSGILEEIAGIYATQETLESVQETLENMIELKKDAAGFSLEVTQLIESYLSDNGFEAAGGELTDSQVSQIETAASQWIADAIKAELETAGSSINKWLGDELAVYMDQMTLGDNLLGQVSTQAIASVMEELDKEASALTEKIQGLIRENNGSLVISKDQLDQEFQNYLATLEANVGLLGSRIQSIVYLPDYVDGLIYFGNGEQYIVLSRENEVTHETEYRNLYLRPSGEEGEQIATLRFRMTPARAVKKYANTEAMSLITEEVGTRAAAGFTIEEIKDIDETTGEFTIVATTDYDYVSAEKAGKTQMVALHVDGSALSEGESNDFETDFTSAFIGTAYAKAGIQIPVTNFVLARADAENEGEYVEYTDEVTTEVKYTDKEVHGVLAGYTVMYKDGETILPLAEAAEANNWTVDLAALVSASAEFTFSDPGSEELYAVDGKALTFAVAESETALIGQTVTAAATYALLDEEGFSLEVKAGAVNKFSIAPDGVELSTPKSEVMWTYAAATSDDTYEAKGLVLTPDKGMLSAVQYNALKDNENLVVELYRGTELVSEIVPSIELPATPTYDTDVQTVDLKLVGDLAQSAEYVVKAVYTNDDKTVVTITIPVSVTGIPEIPMLEQTLELPYNAASSTGHHIAVEEFRALLWESLDQTARAQFGEETFMQLSWTSDMVKDEAGNYATVGASGKNINFVFGKAAALNVSYTVKNLFTTADPVLTFEAVLHVTVTAPEIELLRGSSLSDDDRAQAVMKIEGSTLQIDAFDLSKTWYIAKDAPAEAKVVYATQAEGAVITDATLDWGTCDELSIVVTAQVMYGGKALGEPKTFTVSIADPIADATIAVETGKLVAKVDEDVTLDVATLLTLKAVNDVNVFDGSTNAQNTNTAVAATIEYGEAVVSIPDGRVKFDAESHVLTVVEGGDLELMKEITVTIPVKYVYTFGERTAQIVVNVTK